MNLDYILKKIQTARMSDEPYKHIEIENLFEDQDLNNILCSPEIAIAPAADDEQLFSNLFDAGYKIIEFPGCTTDRKEYIEWHREKKATHKTNTACEGFGVVLRLYGPKSDTVMQLQDFFSSSRFIQCIAERFGISADECSYDAGIQKYLDGYEISPHPDIRKKALTFMVNVNPSPGSHNDEYHTSYLKFKNQWTYVQEYWRYNTDFDRAWVPWDWCNIVKQQRNNNSMVIFSPSHDTLHAVKAVYNHLGHQRTQLYGNLWHSNFPQLDSPSWEALMIRPIKVTSGNKSLSLTNLKSRVPAPIKRLIRARQSSKKQHELGSRNLD